MAKILIVESNPAYSNILEATIKQLGYETFACASAEETLQILQNESYPVVLFDIGLPGMDGLELSRRVRQLPGGEMYFLIVSTAHTQKNNIIEILNHGINDFITKPLNLSTLMVRLTIAQNFIKNNLERKQLEEQLATTEKMRMVGSLATGVAHEVKNPLAIIYQGISYLTKKIKTDNEDIALTLEDIEVAVIRANSIINGILDFSSISAIKIESINLNKFIKKSLLLLGHNLRISQTEVINLFGENLPAIKTDKNKLEHVLINLLVNAIQAMPDGGTLTIRTYIENLEEKPEYVIIEIKDTGKGIPADVFPRIFDPFYTTKRATGGTGLGLSIVKNILDMLQGMIQIKSSPQGTTVLIKFAVGTKNEKKSSGY